jgi:hypothetical protein
MFEAPVADGMTVSEHESWMLLIREARKVTSHSDGEFLIFDTHTIEGRIAGDAFVQAADSGQKASEFARGVFAVSLTPRTTCMPDADGFGCDAVRIRGTFSARTHVGIDPAP